jgi:pyruvate formate lyase activating enzyme
VTGAAAQRIAWTDLVDFLQPRRGLLDAVVFSGGEPTAQSGLADAMRQVRGLGFKIGLHTGGPYPERLAALLPLVDWVGLDIKALPEDYPLVTAVTGSGERAWRSLRLMLDAGIPLEVRTTPLPGLDQRDYLQRLMLRLAEAGVDNYVLQQCQPAHALDPTLAAQTTPLPHNLRPPSAFRTFGIRTAPPAVH